MVPLPNGDDYVRLCFSRPGGPDIFSLRSSAESQLWIRAFRQEAAVHSCWRGHIST